MQRLTQLFALLLTLFTISAANAAEYITATLTITNAPTTNGQTITVKGSARTWTNSVSTAASQILTNSTIGGITTNIFNHFGSYGVAGVLPQLSGTNAVKFRAYDLTLSVSAGWASVVLTTNTSTNTYAVTVPFSSMGSTNRTIIADLLSADLSTYVTTPLRQSNDITSELVGLTNTQTIAGAKTFTGAQAFNNASNTWIGGTNSFNVGRFTNGYWTNAILHTPTLTNGINYGNAFSSPGTNTLSEQFGSGATAAGESATALGSSSTASGQSSVSIGSSSESSGYTSAAIGSEAVASAINSIAIGTLSVSSSTNTIALGNDSAAAYPNSIALGSGSASTTSNQVMIGSSTISLVQTYGRFYAGDGLTNSTLKGATTNAGKFSHTRLNVTSLANGNNAGVDPSTSTSLKVSGPTAAFTINGIAGGYDGRVLIVQNSTGYDMTIANDSGVDPVAANRIYTGLNTSQTFTNNPTFLSFIYDSAVSRWILQTVSGTAVAGASEAFVYNIGLEATNYTKAAGTAITNRITTVGTEATNYAGLRVLKSGDTMTGQLIAQAGIEIEGGLHFADGSDITGAGSVSITTALSGTGATNLVQSMFIPGANVTFTTNADRTVTIAGSASGGASASNAIPVTLSYADTTNVWINASLGTHFILTATNSFQLRAPTNSATDGQTITIRIKQDATGNRIGYPVNATNAGEFSWKFGTDITAFTFSTNAAYTDYITAKYNAGATNWHVVGNVTGY